MPASPAELLSKANAAVLRFLTTELDTGLSFARMAERTRDADKKGRYRHHAHLAYESAFGRLGTAKGTTEQMREITLKMSKLRELLGPDEKL